MFPVIGDAPGGKGGRCVWLTTYHHCSAIVTKTRNLNSPGPLRAYMVCSGMTLPLPHNIHAVIHFRDESVDVAREFNVRKVQSF